MARTPRFESEEGSVNALKRNLSRTRIGTGRGVSLTLAEAIARKYQLSQIIVWTYDRQKRQRILFWGSGDGPVLIAQGFAEHVARKIGWPKENCDFELAFVRRLKNRIKELEVALAQIADGDDNGDPKGLARAAGKFPDESDGEAGIGAWLFCRDVARKAA